MDKELLELCKAVAKRTDWLSNEDESDMYFYWEAGESTEFSIRYRNECPYYSADIYYPIYTSDYLLEKLPPVIFVRTSDGKNNTAILTVWINGDKTAHVAYMIPFDEQNRGDYARESDTPRKALLKLVIALDDAGVKL